MFSKYILGKLSVVQVYESKVGTRKGKVLTGLNKLVE